MSIDDHWIAGNTIVAVPIYTAHRNSSLFPEPEKYEPSRWPHESSKEAQASFIPFSAGARGGIERNITYIEQTMLLAILVQRYGFFFLQIDHGISVMRGASTSGLARCHWRLKEGISMRAYKMISERIRC